MIRIAICDDEKNIGAALERTLIDIFGKLGIKYDIDVFFTGKELFNKMEAETSYNLIFLDIEFAKNEVNGVEVGRQIREVYQNYLASIVYISWEKKYVMQLFDIQPLNFLIKPLQNDKIEEVIKTYLKITKHWSGEFFYKIGHETFKVQIKDIIYLESNDKKICMRHANGNKIEFYKSIKEAYAEQLSKFDFLFIHNAYIVNYDYITSLKFSEVILADEVTSLPISKHRRNEVRERYFEIMKKRMN